MSRALLDMLRKSHPVLTPEERAELYREHRCAPTMRTERMLQADFASALLRAAYLSRRKFPQIMTDEDLDDVLSITFAKHLPLTLEKYDPESGTPFGAYIHIFVRPKLLYEAYKFVKLEYRENNSGIPIAWFGSEEGQGEDNAWEMNTPDGLIDSSDPEAMAVAGDLERLLDDLLAGRMPPKQYGEVMERDYARTIDPWRDRKVLLGTETKRKPRSARNVVA